jgi:acid phosphatase (class A)
MKKKLLTYLVFSSLAASPIAAKEATFLKPDQIRIEALVPPPPADGSQTQKDELKELHRLAAERTPAQAEKASFDAEHKDVFIFAETLGDKFTAENLPLLAALGKEISGDASEIGKAAKAHFHRDHPYTFDKSLQPVCTAKGLPEAYPSGHALNGWLLALALAEMVPEKRAEIFARAADYGRNRLLCSVHYPSDVAASKPLAEALHAAEMQSPEFQRKLAAARGELRARLGLPEAK